MTDVFQFILLNDPAPGVPDCHTQLPGSAKGGAGKRGFVRGNTKYPQQNRIILYLNTVKFISSIKILNKPNYPKQYVFYECRVLRT